jgi:hypothetical protein
MPVGHAPLAGASLGLLAAAALGDDVEGRALAEVGARGVGRLEDVADAGARALGLACALGGRGPADAPARGSAGAAAEQATSAAIKANLSQPTPRRALDAWRGCFLDESLRTTPIPGSYHESRYSGPISVTQRVRTPRRVPISHSSRLGSGLPSLERARRAAAPGRRNNCSGSAHTRRGLHRASQRRRDSTGPRAESTASAQLKLSPSAANPARAAASAAWVNAPTLITSKPSPASRKTRSCVRLPDTSTRRLAAYANDGLFEQRVRETLEHHYLGLRRQRLV